MAASILQSCEKEIIKQLEQLKEYQKALEDALRSIRQAQMCNKDFSIQGNAQEMVNELVTKVIQQSSLGNQSNEADQSILKSKQLDDQPKGAQSASMAVQPASSPQQPPVEDIESTALDDTESAALEDKPDEFVEHLLRIAGAKKGVKYKVEVTSPLHVDGTFWACHVESGFIQNKLEPLSDRLRISTQNDRSLCKVSDYSKMVCTKSLDNGLWMRAIVIKKNNENTMRIRFIDVGRTEDCAKSCLSQVADHLTVIPFMAFNCTLFEATGIKIGYDAKWRFSDYAHKKILNFTCEKLLERDNLIYLYGKFETILDEPVINIGDEIQKLVQFSTSESAKNKDNGVMSSRDMRVQNNTEGFTSVSEVIRNNDQLNASQQTEETRDVSFSETTPSKEEKSKKNKTSKLEPIVIPDATLQSSPIDHVDWGDCKTPGADDYEIELPALDENLFETPTETLGDEEHEDELVAATIANGSTKKIEAEGNANSLPFHQPPSSQTTQNQQFEHDQQLQKQVERCYSFQRLQDELTVLIQHEDELSKNPQLVSEEQLQAVHSKIQLVEQQCLNTQNAMSHSTTNTITQQQQFNQQKFYNQQQRPQQQQHNFPSQHAHFQTMQHSPLPISPKTTQQMPIGNQIMAPRHGSYFTETIQSQNDERTKLNQLSAITQCLQAPNDVLDDMQLENLQHSKEGLEQQLKEEQTRKDQTEKQWMYQAMLTEHKSMDSMAAEGSMSDYINPIFKCGKELNQEQLQYLRQVQSQAGNHPHTVTTLTQEGLAENYHKQKSEPHNNSVEKTCIEKQAQSFLDKQSHTYEQQMNYASNNHHVSDVKEPLLEKQIVNDVKSNCNDSVTNNKNEVKIFEIVPIEMFETESRNDWTARELCNLTHPYFEHPNARFFTVIVIEIKPGIFTSMLQRVYSSGYYWLHDNDAEAFKKEWDHSHGPLFLIIKHKPLVSTATWKIGGICQVVSRITQIPVGHRKNNANYQCRVKFVSVAVITDGTDWLDKLRSDKVTREIQNDTARRFIKRLIRNIQQGNCESVFDLQGYQSHYKGPSNELLAEHYNEHNERKALNHDQLNRNQVMSSPENWELDLKQSKLNSDDYGSGDECERDLNAEIEAFGFSEEDFT